MLQILLAEGRPLLADGATGTNLFEMGLASGETPELWNDSQPGKIRALHQAFVDAGADIILTNSFGGNRRRLMLHKLEGRVRELNRLAAEIARDVRRAQVSPQTALTFIEQLWNTELSGFDVDGPLPAFDPVVSDELISKGRASVRQFAKDPVALAGDWRARAEAGNLSAREVVIEVTGRQSFIGSAETIATTLNDLVQADAADGYILVPHITPGGLVPFVDHVVPLLQERGVFRVDYTGSTLRDNLGLAPLGSSAEATAARAAS